MFFLTVNTGLSASLNFNYIFNGLKMFCHWPTKEESKSKEIVKSKIKLKKKKMLQTPLILVCPWLCTFFLRVGLPIAGQMYKRQMQTHSENNHIPPNHLNFPQCNNVFTVQLTQHLDSSLSNCPLKRAHVLTIPRLTRANISS